MSGQNFLQRLCLVIKKKATSNPTPPQCQMSEGKAREKARNQTFIGLLQHNQTIHVRSPARARFSIRLCVCVCGFASFRLNLKSDRGRLSFEGSSGSYQKALVLAMPILSAEDSHCAGGDFGR